MEHHFYIEFQDIYLHPLSEKHLESLLKLRNQFKDCFMDSRFITMEEKKKWFRKYQQKENDFMFAIACKESDFIGAIALYDIDSNTESAEFGRIMVKVDSRIQHTGTKAIIAILEFAKKKLNLKTVSCVVLKNNLKAIKVYENIGFQRTSFNDKLLFLKIDLDSLNKQI